MKQKAIILGGGVIGVSTAIMLHASGVDVEIVSERFLWDESNEPTFASVYPAASVIPHSVGGETKTLYDNSYAVFKQLAIHHPHMVRVQKHLELTESTFQYRDYFAWMGAEPVDSDTFIWRMAPLKRAAAAHVGGVGFDILFVEMPAYKAFLKQAVQNLQIKVTRTKINRQIFKDLSDHADVLCNCLGLTGPLYIEDDSGMEGVAGILVCSPIDRLLKNATTGTPISYNYHFDGLEVYSYPRTYDIVFGGTRISVNLDEDPIAQVCAYFKQKGLSYKLYNRIPVPDYIIEVNQELHRNLYGVDIKVELDARATLGLRPVRKGGVRLERSEPGVINNYGYGGAGVTLSWGAAIEVGKLMGVSTNDRLTDLLPP